MIHADILENVYEGERCFILGNGPSLNDTDLSFLEDEVTFGTNRIYLSGFQPSYYVAVNPLVIDQFHEDIRENPPKELQFLSSSSGKEYFGDHKTVFLNTKKPKPSFGPIHEPIWEGHTVTYVALQIAYYMGFDKVYLVGVDHYYGLDNHTPNAEIESQSEDRAHFHPDYFGPGVKWNLPDLTMSEWAYSLANKAYQDDGREIINLSKQTELDIFPLENYLNVVDCPSVKVSAIVSAYYAENFIDGCLTDLERQTIDGLEIVVVCQEGSQEHQVASYHEEHCPPEGPLYNIITTEGVPGVYEAWNIGIKAARGQYITNANTDDRHYRGAYRMMVEVLEGRTGVDLVYHDSYITWMPNQTYEEFSEEYKGERLVQGRIKGKPGIFHWHDYDKTTLVTKGCYIGPHPMWRANIHQRYGYFDESFESSGDYEFWLRIAGESNFFHIPRPLGLYLASPDGIELSSPELSREESARAIQKNMSGQVRIEPYSDVRKLVRVDGSYSVIDVEQLTGLLEFLADA